MARTDMLRRQHTAAIELVHEISSLCHSYRGDKDAYTIGLRLAKLTGLLRIHFAQEDRSLYPAMMSSSNPTVATKAKAFREEMGHIGPAFEAFAEKWGSSSAIAGSFDAFRQQSAQMFAALGDRINRENEDLYSLADDLCENLPPVS